MIRYTDEAAGRPGKVADAPRVAVVILTWNQADTTLRCLESLAGSEGVTFETLVWDNGSEDDTVHRVREAFPDVRVAGSDRNLGVAGGRNAAAAEAERRFDPTHLLFLDNDIVVSPRFVADLLDPFADDERLGQAQGKLLYLDDPGRINDGGGCRIEWWRGRTDPLGFKEIDRGQCDRPMRPMACCGGAMLVRADVFRALDGFDESFSPFGPEDLDFSLRLQEAGWRTLYVPGAVAWHEVSHSFGAGYTEEWASLKVKHWLRLLRRHASLPQRLAFFLVGGPLAAAGMAIRELRRGNAGAVLAAFRSAARGEGKR